MAARVALVTGGAAGIGRAVAARLAAEGLIVVAADLAAPVEAASGVLDVALDVCEPDAVTRVVDAVAGEHGGLDVLVTSAAVSLGESFLETRPETWSRTLAVNLTGPFLCGQAAARVMIERGTGGRIVNLASLNGLLAERGAASYVASKGGVLGLTRAMAVDLAPHGIAVNAVCPGPIRTDRNAALFDGPDYRQGIERGIPLGRAGTPMEVAGAVSWLASENASFVTGAALALDGGYSAYLRLD